jgi:hypothetical protein
VSVVATKLVAPLSTQLAVKSAATKAPVASKKPGAKRAVANK